MNILSNGIEAYGVTENIILTSNYFKEFDFQVTQNIESEEAIIEKILSVNVDINIGDLDIIKTPIMLSNDGVYFSGCKLKVELIIDIKIKYILATESKQLKLVTDKLMKTIYIVLPTENGQGNMIDLLRRKKIRLIPCIEDIYCEERKGVEIYTNVSAIIFTDFIEE